jgi:hypothetical protein
MHGTKKGESMKKLFITLLAVFWFAACGRLPMGLNRSGKK